MNSLAALRGSGDADGPGDVIFVYQGSGTYGGGLPLEALREKNHRREPFLQKPLLESRDRKVPRLAALRQPRRGIRVVVAD